ncbi:flagellar basal-body rod modification protein FlgD [Nocardioides terrae]|uniref:Flagellar basal-body rod modification protein FlgD n=1 Tax=Nocardioides terrae TaxID=574651 RepID=A0A1I1II96_9ACTN|nr:flagellar hook capping FlgD N-terminal domain-containing protein [Nocardioides terrae]SFC32950.1 flagellar basal-body rod modification protein FlgD [Nocardioides terrae]
MSVTATESVNPGLLAMAGSPADSAKGAADQDMFMQLLVAQLKYQDPMNPADTTQMMSQNAQYSALQEMQKVSAGMNQLLSAQLSFGAAGMLGQQVSYLDANGVSQSGVPSGVSFLPTGPVLTIDGADVPVSSITSVGTPSAALPAATSTSTSTPA